VRQQALATLGRKDVLAASGELDALVRSLACFSENLRVVEAVRSRGPAVVFGRLWERQGILEVLRTLAGGRRFRFDIERAVFAMALQRLCEPGSDLQGNAWVKTVEAPGFEALGMQHFYRTCVFLLEVRQELERRLYFHDRDLFSTQLDLIFLGTTSLYVYRDTETL
jgi:hypothetical protein